MKLEDLLNTIIDGNYPDGFVLSDDVEENVYRICTREDWCRFKLALKARYYNWRSPVAGSKEVRQGKRLGNLYTNGYRAIFCQEVLDELNRPKWMYWTRPIKKHYAMWVNPSNRSYQ